MGPRYCTDERCRGIEHPLERARAALVKVMESTFGRPPLFFGKRRFVRQLVRHSSNTRLDTRINPNNGAPRDCSHLSIPRVKERARQLWATKSRVFRYRYRYG